jgi:azobenzene reductase
VNGEPCWDCDSESTRVLLLSGSVREPSHTRALTEHVTRALWSRGVEARHWSLYDFPLGVADPEFHDDPLRHIDDRVRAFATVADDCDAFVLASPLYHNSYSGVLKNALDHLAIRQFQYKPVGLLSHGGNRSPQAVDHLRIVVRGLRGLAIPSQVCTLDRDYRPAGPGYVLESEDVLHRIERLAGELVFFALQLRPARLAITERERESGARAPAPSPPRGPDTR